MIYQLFAIKDAKSNVYADLFQLPNTAIAIRKFSEVCRDEKSDLYKYPEDFALYKIGAYDIEKGTVCGPEEPIKIDEASNYKQAKTN